MTLPYLIAELNQMSQPDFVAALGAVFEDTPAIAQKVWEQRPFTDQDDLHQKMVMIVNGLSQADQLSLIRSNPDLGSKAKMADASVEEQLEVGLDRLTSDECDRFHQLNQAYKSQFGFPFIIAVKNHTKATILQAFEQRLKNAVDTERQQALSEIIQIAYFRLHSLIN